ncbi:putative membrane protein [Saccharothrix espanaensis DSM 44229]|uniref:Putative membrane protein n=1 Tax=Saccharothrix espanaensis (strain ATCC 51144 / DSM 44229 / JCM 9112 / NBRC 15066 / NRRL 15764) TaxID=1179773 RepID=K0JZB8_SACES|nr:putative membrane protein [Saccharothrix espanaensis DSM 44229]
MGEQPARKGLSEDWLAVVVGLALFALAVAGVIPPGLVP